MSHETNTIYNSRPVAGLSSVCLNFLSKLREVLELETVSKLKNLTVCLSIYIQSSMQVELFIVPTLTCIRK